MNRVSTARAQELFPTSFTPKLKEALRGGAILLAASLIWNLLLQREELKDPGVVIYFVWLPSIWLVFPLGALLGCFLPRWVDGRSLVQGIAIGVFLGAIASVLLAAALWVWMNHQDLLGLVLNRHSGGYASYSLSVTLQLQRQAWWVLTHVLPVTWSWVALWTLWTNRSPTLYPLASTREDSSGNVRLRLDRQLLRFVGWVACGLAAFTTVGLVVLCVAGRSSHTPLIGFVLVGPVAAALMILGPWLGPLIHPGGGGVTALRLTALALPIFVAALTPFIRKDRSVGSGAGAIAWCGLVTALLFWAAIGAISLGWSIG